MRRRRARLAGAVTGDPVNRDRIADRDGWRCGICNRAVNPVLAYPHPRSASLDHIIPLAEGGSHEPANIRLAHLTCNVGRGARGGNEQLALVG
ncbi:HNH endonuclease [Kribbella sp. NPDC050470]|uniref:HNH endonuclease n=1 Tax=unclassified Kribbella TaxID=2644121 RepID=UPI003796A142